MALKRGSRNSKLRSCAFDPKAAISADGPHLRLLRYSQVLRSNPVVRCAQTPGRSLTALRRVNSTLSAPSRWVSGTEGIRT